MKGYTNLLQQLKEYCRQNNIKYIIEDGDFCIESTHNRHVKELHKIIDSY